MLKNKEINIKTIFIMSENQKFYFFACVKYLHKPNTFSNSYSATKSAPFTLDFYPTIDQIIDNVMAFDFEQNDRFQILSFSIINKEQYEALRIPQKYKKCKSIVYTQQ